MYNIILNNIKKYNLIKSNSKIVVGISGGSDSMCLLHILNKIKNTNDLGYTFSLVAVHINHNLRGDEALNDEMFVRKYCENNDIQIIVYSEDIEKLSKQNKQTIEEYARTFRKEKFEKLLENDNDKIALAHNLPDNAETMLMHLFRGSGLKGLISMGFCDNNIIRPLLNINKEDIYSYLKDNDIAYCTDKTNFTEIYTRNKVRLSLLPYIEQNFNKNIISSLNNTIEMLKIDNNFIEQQAKLSYNNVVSKYNNCIRLNILKLLELDEAILTRVIIFAFNELNGTSVDLNFRNINDIKSLLTKEANKQIKISKDIIVHKGYFELIFIKDIYCNIKSFSKNIKLDEITKISENRYILISENNITPKNYKIVIDNIFSFSKGQNFYIRNKKDGDKIFIKNVGHKDLKKFFTEKKIETIFRNSINLLATDDNLLMILDKKIISTDNSNIGNFSYYVKVLEQTEV